MYAFKYNLTYYKYLAMLHHEIGENNKSIDILTEILKSERIPEVLLLLADVLRIEHKFPEAIEYLEELINTEASEVLKEDARRLLIRLYVELKDFLILFYQFLDVIYLHANKREIILIYLL